MKRFVLFSLILLLPILCFAREPVMSLYAQPSVKSKVLQKISMSANWVPFFQKDEWVKVGDSKTGQTGWINRKEFPADTFVTHSSEESIQITTDKNGKEKIIAYKNGKKLKTDEAKNLWKRMQAQQKEMQKEFHAMQARMMKMQRALNRMFERQMRMMDDMWK